MGDISADTNQEARVTKKELLARIDRSLAELNQTLRGLTEKQLTTPGPEKWAVKDHLVHLAVWELGIAELLQHRDRFAAMNVDEDFVRTKSGDEVNDVIFQQTAHLTLDEANVKFEDAHRRFLAALDSLDDDDLYRPYAYFVPAGHQAPHRPVIEWIAGNTFGHYEEHNQFIKTLVQSLH